MPIYPKIVCIGEPLFEFNQAPGKPYYLPGHGGDTSNCAIAAARQGASVAYVTAIGVDEFGDSFMDLWDGEGVDTTRVIRNPNADTGAYFVTHTPEGHSFSYLRRGSAASLFSRADVPEDYIECARIVHVSGISQAISQSACEAVRHVVGEAHRKGVMVSYDPNLRLKLWPLERARAVIHEAVALAHIVLPALEDGVALTGLSDPDAIVDFYLELGPSIVALTLGSEGVLVATRDARSRISGHSVEAVDATGAGDTFDGAFLARFLEKGDPFEAARYANAAAALSTLRYGAAASIPRKEEVLRFLEG
jgi:2-dehydro-3-deoxygluconokinase